ncbi:dTMP kinase, partial [bacterium]|nr:dTMP kinase [bacterium]
MFVCFEGVDGAGKSTQARMLYQRLKKEGRAVEQVADPGTTKIGTAIRQILLHNDAPITTMAQMLLFSAARAELAEYIRAQLIEGVVIICDRWLLSTFVYQGEINNVPKSLILDIYNATANVIPDVCFLLDLSPEVARARIGTPADRYERRCFEDWQRVCAAYHKYATPGVIAHRVHKIAA